MGRLNGLIKPEGTFGGLTFYRTADGYLVRTKGGNSKEKIMNNPSFARTRENAKEFGLSAKSGKMLRDSVGILLNRAKDSKLSSRMLKMMNEIKKLDIISARGERKVSIGLASESGKQLLKNFDFNIHAPLSSILRGPYVLDPASGSLRFDDFSTQEQMSTPENATHVRFRSAFVNLDFETGIYQCRYSPETDLPISNVASPLTLTPESVPEGSGTQLYLLMIEFLQEVNGIKYPLQDDSYNALNIVEVI